MAATSAETNTLSPGSTNLHKDTIKVTIRRSHLIKSATDPATDVPLQWSLNNPNNLLIHMDGSGERCIFDRSDVTVNSPKRLEDAPLKSSLDDRLQGTRDDQIGKREDIGEHQRQRSKHCCNSRSSSKEYDRYWKDKPDSRKESYRNASKNYKSSGIDKCSCRNCVSSTEIRSKKTLEERTSNSVEREGRPKDRRCCDNERGRKDYSDSSPDQCDINQRCSHSVCSKDGGYKQRRERSPRNYSERHRSSSYNRKQSCFHSQKRNSSPHSQKNSEISCTRYVLDTNSTLSYKGDYTRDLCHGHATTKRSISRTRRSPDRTELAHKSKRCSKSPVSSPVSSSSKTDKSSDPEEIKSNSSSTDISPFSELPGNFLYYGAEGFWIPAPGPRFIPPALAIPSRSPILPRPPFNGPRPFMPFPHPAHRYMPYGLPVRPRIGTPATFT